MGILRFRNESSYGGYQIVVSDFITHRAALDRLDRQISDVSRKVPEMERKIINFSAIERISDGINHIYDEFGVITDYQVNPRNGRLDEINEMTIRFLDRHYQQSKDSNKTAKFDDSYLTDRQIKRRDRKEHAVEDIGEFHIGVNGNSRKSYADSDNDNDDKPKSSYTRVPVPTDILKRVIDSNDAVKLLESCNEVLASSYGTGYAAFVASDALADLRRAISLAGLTDAETAAIHFVYSLEIEPQAASRSLGITQSAIYHRLRSAESKIQAVYDGWASINDDVTHELDGISGIDSMDRHIYDAVVKFNRAKSSVANELGVNRKTVDRRLKKILDRLA